MYVQKLIERISNSYDRVFSHVTFPISKKSNAEIDVFAIKDDIIDIYEVKCSYRISKARKQLKRAKRVLELNGNTYFYCGSSDSIQAIEISDY